MDLKESSLLGEKIDGHWYYTTKAMAVSKVLGDFSPNIILDVGAGSGFFSKYLLRSTTAKSAHCIDIGYPEDFERKYAGKNIFFARSVDRIGADLILMMDVLEHVDDDLELLIKYVKMSPRGAKFLITVPAFEFMWSDHDVFLDHKRRYTLNQLKKVVNNSGLQINYLSYYFSIIFPIAFIVRMFSKLRSKLSKSSLAKVSSQSSFINKLLTILCEFELRFMKYNNVGGLTVICLAEKLSH